MIVFGRKSLWEKERGVDMIEVEYTNIRYGNVMMVTAETTSDLQKWYRESKNNVREKKPDIWVNAVSVLNT